jgi:hypothetical protein
LRIESRSSSLSLAQADGKRFHHQAELLSQHVVNNRSLDCQLL